MKYSLSSLILFLCLTFSSCIEFEREKLSYIHDVEKDELRVTLTYEGIFGNLDKGEYTQKNRDDVATHESLNQLQIDQLESVLREKRAFFFSNWIAEYSKPSVEKMLKSIIKGNKHGKFGDPENKLIELLHKNVDVQNVGFYKNKVGKLCGAQTVKISNISQVLASANEVIQRQIIAHIPQLRKELEEKTPSAWSQKTIDLIEKKLKNKFEFIQLEGNLMTFSTILAEAEQKKVNEDILKDWPSGTRVKFRDEGIDVKIGGKDDKVGKLSKKCFDEYQSNALNYIEKTHGELLLSPRNIGNQLTNFLNAEK
ncbi:hypothetical protein N9N13_03910 [Opitutales bacterium]|jgi:hypothetical protein|nr:hypothetical protein [Opitutales bacterium]